MNYAEFIAPDLCPCCGGKSRAVWTPQRCVDAVQKWAAEHDGDAPQARDWRHGKPDHPPASRVVRLFGRWTNLIRAAGFEPHKCGTRPWRKKEIADAMLDHLFRFGRWPRASDWKQPVGEAHRPHYETVLRHFGTWNDARRYAGWTGDNNPQPLVEPRCKECGAELENTTLGCHTCSERASSRRARDRAHQATTLREAA